MEYKGKHIEDKCYKFKYNKIEEHDCNSMEFTAEDLDRWKEILAAKEKELTEAGADFKNVRLLIQGDGFHYNPNGADDDAYMEIHLQWKEAETEEEKLHRIEKSKRKIDEEIATEEAHKKYLEEKKQMEMDKAIRLLRANGYNVV